MDTNSSATAPLDQKISMSELNAEDPMLDAKVIDRITRLRVGVILNFKHAKL